LLLRSNTRADTGTHYESVIPGALLQKNLVLVSQTDGERLLRCPITSQKYLLFQHPSPLSNFAQLQLTVENKPYSSVEQFYQAAKFTEGSNIHTRIMDCTNPFKIKGLGKNSPTRSPPQNTMVKGLTAKFAQKGPHHDHLLDSSECILMEATHDKVWGIGRDFTRDRDPSQYLNRTNWTGSNKLGIEIMRVRSDLIHNVSTPSKVQDSTEKGPSAPCALKPLPHKPTLSSAWANPPTSIREKGSAQTPCKPTTPVRKNRLVSLPQKGLYIPPQGMQAREVIATVTSQNPTLGRCLAYEKGKITSSNPEALKALKSPLLPDHPSLCKPLNRFLPTGTVESHWLSSPIPNMAGISATIASNPRVVHVSKHDKNSTHTIWHITTGYVAEPSSKHKEPNYLEAGTLVLNLVPYTLPIRCTFCQSIEHTKFDCFAEYSSCVFCAGHHSSAECGQKWRHKCARCLGPHKASDPSCPDIKSKKARQGLPQLCTPKPEGQSHTTPVPRRPTACTVKCHEGPIPQAHQEKLIPKAQQTPSVEGNIPSLFAVKFTAHHIETLFSPAAYQRISKRLFPSLVAPTRTDGSCLPSIATSAHSNTGVSLHHPSPPLKSVQQQKTDHKWVAPRYRRQSTPVKQSPRDYRQATPVTQSPTLLHPTNMANPSRSTGRGNNTKKPFVQNGPFFHPASCPAVGDVSDTPPFLIPLISQLHGYLRHGINYSIPH
ncbi:MAG: NADAR family protein, partial [Ketobacter sp.]|nr:NADAR family protein [Ketobacter sp.]